MDVFNKKKRTEIMKSVKSNNNRSTELKLIKIFKENNIKGWIRNYKALGKPDFVFLKKKTAVFVDGCFWHGHNCRNITPKDNSDYWDAKRERNRARDELINRRFINRKWNVIRIWECELKELNRELLIKKIGILMK